MAFAGRLASEIRSATGSRAETSIHSLKGYDGASPANWALCLDNQPVDYTTDERNKTEEMAVGTVLVTG